MRLQPFEHAPQGSRGRDRSTCLRLIPFRRPSMSKPRLTVALVGNPNAGKTTLFNALSGLRHRVGNYPGVTVEIAKGRRRGKSVDLELIDLPGTYSLAPRSPDELVAVDLLLGRCPGE